MPLVMRTHAIETFLLIAWTSSKLLQLAFLTLGNLSIIVRNLLSFVFSHLYQSFINLPSKE